LFRPVNSGIVTKVDECVAPTFGVQKMLAVGSEKNQGFADLKIDCG